MSYEFKTRFKSKKPKASAVVRGLYDEIREAIDIDAVSYLEICELLNNDFGLSLNPNALNQYMYREKKRREKLELEPAPQTNIGKKIAASPSTQRRNNANQKPVLETALEPTEISGDPRTIDKIAGATVDLNELAKAAKK